MNFISETRRRLQPDPVDLALRQLCEDPYAVGYAKILLIAEPLAHSLSSEYAMTDCFGLAADRLDDLIFDAARDHDLDRDQLPVRGGVVERLGRLPLRGTALSSPSSTGAGDGR